MYSCTCLPKWRAPPEHAERNQSVPESSRGTPATQYSDAPAFARRVYYGSL